MKCKILLIVLIIACLFLGGCKEKILILKDKMIIPEQKCKSLDKYIFIYETGCPHCLKILPEIEQVEKEMNITFKKYNLAFEKDMKELSTLEILPQGVPCVIISCKVFLGAGYKAEDFKKEIRGS